MTTLPEPERVDQVPGQLGLPGMPEEGVLFHVEPRPAFRVGERVTCQADQLVTRP